jgi:hypothetical protein
MLEFPTLAKLPIAINAAPVAVLLLAGLWALRRLVKLALVLFLAAVAVGGLLWARGGL